MSVQVARMWKHLDIRRRDLSNGGHIARSDVADMGIEEEENDFNDDLELVSLSRYGSLESVKMLMENNLNVNDKSSNGDTPLLAACDGGRLEIVQYLLRHNASVLERDARKRTVLHRVRIGEMHHDIVIDLLEAGADIDADDFDIGTPLHLACACVEAKKAKCFISLGAKLNATNINGATALHLAASRGALDIVKYLLDAGANVGLRTDNWLAPLHVACFNGWLDIARVLVERGALIAGGDLGTRDGVTPLHVACVRDNVQVLDFLLDAGEANIPDSTGATALHYACRHLAPITTRHLLRRGAKVNAADWHGRDALAYLLRNGHRCHREENMLDLWHDNCHSDMIRLLKYLLEEGLALPSITDDDSCVTTADSDSLSFVQEEDEYDDEDDIAYSRDELDDFAVIQKHSTVVKLLLKAGASLESLCSDSETLFFEDYITMSDGEELSIISAWLHWRMEAGYPMNGITIADTLSQRLGIVMVLNSEEAAAASDSDDDDDAVEAFMVRRRKCCDAVKHDIELIRSGARSPRTLMHIARLKLRSHLLSLSNNCSIFPLINALPLPRLVRNLVKFSDLDPCSDDEDDEPTASAKLRSYVDSL